MSSVKERLQEFLREEGISASEFSRKMGLSPAYIASMRKSMPEEKVERLTQLFPQLNRDWLLYGEGDMYRATGDPEIDPHRLDRYMIPLIPFAARGGSFSEYTHSVKAEDCKKIYCPVKEAELAIRVQGDSMEPNIKDRTILALTKINEKAFIPWGNPMVLDTENGSVVKLIYPSKKGEDYIEARSYNPNYPPFQIQTESIFGMYRIVYQMSEGVSF